MPPVVGMELILTSPSYNILNSIHVVNSRFNLCYCWVQEVKYEWEILVNNIS